MRPVALSAALSGLCNKWIFRIKSRRCHRRQDRLSFRSQKKQAKSRSLLSIHSHSMLPEIQHRVIKPNHSWGEKRRNRAIGKGDTSREIDGGLRGSASLPAESKPRRRQQLPAPVRSDGQISDEGVNHTGRAAGFVQKNWLQGKEVCGGYLRPGFLRMNGRSINPQPKPERETRGARDRHSCVVWRERTDPLSARRRGHWLRRGQG
jgi:hypothetical protein